MTNYLVGEKAHVGGEVLLGNHANIGPEVCKDAFGISASLDTAFRMGDQYFGVFKISEPYCLTNAPKVKVNTPCLIMQFDEDMRVSHERCKGLRPGEEVVLGREFPGRFSFSPRVSRKHAKVALSFDGKVRVYDLGSLNGTTDAFDLVAEYVEESTYSTDKNALRKNIGLAKQVENWELTRARDNDGMPLEEVYKRNQAAVRAYFVDTLVAENLYSDRSGELFAKHLKKAHMLASADDIYRIVGKGRLKVNAGEFRTKNLANTRKRDAQEISSAAAHYGDPYGRRFQTEGVMKVQLDNIPSDSLPYDSIFSGEYKYYYPPANAIPNYIKQINRVGVEIVEQLKSKNSSPEDTIRLIARQYQYGATIRPFYQINNSLFMNLANAQLKLLGYKGISHGKLDMLAQRLQPEAFARLFLDTVKKQQ